MSINFQKEISSRNNQKLYINFGGISHDDKTSKEELTLSIFSFDASNYSHVFKWILNYDEIQKIYSHLNSISIIRDGESVDISEFTEITPELAEIISMVNNVDSGLVRSLLAKANENQKLKVILEALSESEIQNLHAAIRQTNHQKSLVDLAHLLLLEESSNITESIKEHSNLLQYSARQPEKIFQNWIEKNVWTLGIDYIKRHPARKIGIDSESDLIMETTDGFIDLIELKRPKFEIFNFDESHKSYYPSRELAKVLGQCMQYLRVLEDYKLILEKAYKFKVLRPRIKIIVGRSHSFTDEEFEALRVLNASLSHIQIISYDYLVLCGKNIISYYSRQLEEVVSEPDAVLPAMS
jgi:hypothetical protein